MVDFRIATQFILYVQENKKYFLINFSEKEKNCLDEKIVDVAKVNQQHCCLEQRTAEA